MIPKTIHCCWFGRGEKSDLIKKCIESWKRVLPNYQIIEWNEDNFDVNCCDYTREAYAAKKWAFVSDYARLWALYNYGGIYLDTDVELYKSLDLFLENDFFAGFESNDIIACGVIGSNKNNAIIKEFFEVYTSKKFINEDGTLNFLANPHIFTSLLQRHGVTVNGKQQCNSKMSIYPQNIFYPNTFGMIFGWHPKASVSIHYGEKSWVDKTNSDTFVHKLRAYAVGVARNIIGTKRLEDIRDRRNQ